MQKTKIEVKSAKILRKVRKDYLHWIKKDSYQVSKIQHNILGENCFANEK